MSIKENIEKLEGPQEENDEDDKIWENMLDSAQDIQSLNSRIEFYGQRKNEIKVSSCIADVVQGTLLMMLLLRRDLRIRALLSLSTVAGHLGTNPTAGSALGYS